MPKSKRVSNFLMGSILIAAVAGFVPMVYAQEAGGAGVAGPAGRATGGGAAS